MLRHGFTLTVALAPHSHPWLLPRPAGRWGGLHLAAGAVELEQFHQINNRRFPIEFVWIFASHAIQHRLHIDRRNRNSRSGRRSSSSGNSGRLCGGSGSRIRKQRAASTGAGVGSSVRLDVKKKICQLFY